MEPEDKKAIQSNYSSLVERTDLDSMVNALYEKGVFSEQMIEPYRNRNNTIRDRKRKLYVDIMKRGPQAFGHLVDALSELGHWDLVRELDPGNPFAGNRRPTASSNPIPNRDSNPASSEDFVSLSNEKQKTKTEQQKKMTAAQPPLPPTDLDNAADMTEIPDIVVEKSKKFMEENDNNDLKLYNTRGPQENRGMLVILTYVSFKNNIEDPRKGAEVDCEMLKKLFSEIGFRVLSYMNLDYQETIDTLCSLEHVLVNVDSVFIVVSSHGYERQGSTDTDIRCSDGRLISFYDIMAYFTNTSLPKLIGIPKVFIFQVCRGGNSEYSSMFSEKKTFHMTMPADVRVDGSTAGAGVADLAPVTSRAALAERRDTPLYSDILIAHSTVPGLASYRNPKSGSWYIQALCEVFAKRAHDTHVDKLFTLVDMRMREKHAVQTSSVDRWGFNKLLYLHPGLFE